MILSHPNRQHVWETAVGGQRAGVLLRFFTAMYNTRQGVSRLLGSASQRYRRRCHPDLDPALVEAVPWFDWTKQLARGPLRGARLELQSWANDQFDRTVARKLRRYDMATVIHGFEASSLYTFRQGRRMGLATVLDVPSATEWFARAVSCEAAAAGLAPRPATARWADYLQRERDLADWLFVGAEQVRRCLMENGVDNRRIVTIPYAADPAIFRPAAPERQDGVFRVVFAGHIGLRKGVRHLLEAFSRLRLSNAELVLIGQPDADGRALMERYAGVHRWIPSVPQAGLADWFRRSSVFAFPSLAEGSAFVIYEAMCAGLPVIVSAQSGSVVRDGQDGLILPQVDATNLALALQKLFDDRGLARDMGTSGRQRILQGFTWQHYQQRLAAAYRAIHRSEDVQAAVDATLIPLGVPA